MSVDFSHNYENKELHEIQSAYFGHEAFTVFTSVCYHHSFDTEVMDDEQSGFPHKKTSRDLTEKNIKNKQDLTEKSQENPL